jgi:hypothetical protein
MLERQAKRVLERYGCYISGCCYGDIHAAYLQLKGPSNGGKSSVRQYPTLLHVVPS